MSKPTLDTVKFEHQHKTETMNTLRQFSYRTMHTAIKPTQRMSTTTFHHRFIQRSSSPFLRSKHLTKNYTRASFLSSRRFSGVFGPSVIGAFIKTSLVFYAIPITAAVSPYFNTLPMDVIYGIVLPYHAYIGMAHILTGLINDLYLLYIALIANLRFVDDDYHI